MYYLLGISILAASFNSVLLNKANINKNEIFKFNLIGFIVWLLILFITGRKDIYIDNQVLFWGIAYGLTQALFIIFKTAAMGSGPVSVTTLIGNCSLVISVLVSLIIWNERITPIDTIGLCLLLTGIYMCIYKKTNSSYDSKWKYFVFFFFVFAAMVGIVFKAFGKSDVSEHCDAMMIISAFVMCICCLIACIVTGGISFKKCDSGLNVRFFTYGIACGALSCLYNRLNIFLAGVIDGVIFFPSFNGGVVLFSALISLLFCKETLEKRQKIGILLGITAICLIGIL